MKVLDFYGKWVMDADIRQRLSDVIKQARGNMSQRQFAKRLGVSFATIRSWEECESMPGTKNLEAIAALLGQSLEEFLHYLRGDTVGDVENSNLKAEDLLAQVNQLPPSEVARLIQLAASRLVQLNALSEERNPGMTY